MKKSIHESLFNSLLNFGNFQSKGQTNSAESQSEAEGNQEIFFLD